MQGQDLCQGPLCSRPCPMVNSPTVQPATPGSEWLLGDGGGNSIPPAADSGWQHSCPRGKYSVRAGALLERNGGVSTSGSPGTECGPSPLLEATSRRFLAKDLSSRTGQAQFSATHGVVEFEGLLQTGHGLSGEKHGVSGAPITWAPLTCTHSSQNASAAPGSSTPGPRHSLAGHLSPGAPEHQTFKILLKRMNLRYRRVTFLPLPTWVCGDAGPGMGNLLGTGKLASGWAGWNTHRASPSNCVY